MPTIDRSVLRGSERWIVPLLDGINTRRRLKELEYRTNQHLWSVTIDFLLGRRFVIDGLEPLKRLRPPHGVLLVANHRTLFDMYIATSILMCRTRIARRIYFPVRSNYWYDTRAGLLVNMLVSGGAMWPPIFRDDRRFRCNPVGLEQMAAALGPGALLGMHPEGKRKTDPDVWTQLSAKRGVGQLVQSCDPSTLVLPYFIAGIGNHLLTEIRANFRDPQRWPIRIRFGEPVAAGELVSSEPAGRSAIQIATGLMEIVHELGLADRDRHGDRPHENPSLAHGPRRN